METQFLYQVWDISLPRGIKTHYIPWEDQCLSEAKKVPRLYKSTGIPKGIYEGLHISAGMRIYTRFLGCSHLRHSVPHHFQSAQQAPYARTVISIHLQAPICGLMIVLGR